MLLWLGYTATAFAKSSLVDEPSGCLSKQRYPCAILFQKSQKLEVSGAQVWAARGTSLVLFAADKEKQEIKLLEGKVWVRSKSTVMVDHAEVEFRGSGDLWFERSANNQLNVKNLNGQLSVKSPIFATGFGGSQDIPVGFENWYQGINTTGKVEQGVLKPILEPAFFKSWNRFTKLPVKEATQVIKTYQTLWKSNAQAAAEMYKETIERRLASMDVAAAQQERQRLRHLQEEQNLKTMFLNRYNMTDVP